jgi:hypothetical protein
MTYDEIFAEARERGAEAGRSAASWAFDGNTPDETYHAFLTGTDAGDPETLDSFDYSPLSGEWSGESITELLGDLLDGLDDEGEGWDVMAAYEDAALDAYWAELERIAHYHTDDTKEDGDHA